MVKYGEMKKDVILEIAQVNGLRMTQKRTSALRRIALVVVSRYYIEYREEIGRNISPLRESLVVCFMKGHSVAECYEQCVNFKSETESFFGKVKIGKGRSSDRVKRNQKWLQRY